MVRLQPWAEAWCSLFMIRARRIVKIVMRAGICTPHRTLLDLNQLEPRSYLSSVYTHCVYLFRHRITIRCLPLGHVQSRGAGSLIIFIIRKTLQKVKSKAHKISLLCAFFFKVQLQSAISCTYPRNNVLRRTENARKKCAKMHGKRTISII